MKNVEKILNTLAHNLGYTIVMFAAIIMFAIFSDGLLDGIITACSAVIAYACVVLLYKEYKKPSPSKKKAK